MLRSVRTIIRTSSSTATAARQQFSNTTSGFKNLLSWLKKLGANQNNSFVGMEHTGHYTLALCFFLQEREITYTLISPLQLKKSLGLVRGKSDQVDSKRIAQFICLHQRLLRPVRLASDCLLKLKNLMAFRERLVKSNASLKKTLQDLKDTSDLIDNTFIIKLSEKQRELVEQQISYTDKQIEVTLQQDEQVWKHFELVNSVVGIGLVTAVAFLIHTQDFTAFDNGRQFACYAGVAPFEHISGISVKGKTRVSPLANKKMKALLSNCAAAAVQHDPQLKAYRSGGRYQRKLNEGKPKMTVLNAVRAKLINRVFATVDRGTPYVTIKHYPQAA
ncbi:IS110 family transposase [Telluribacter sp.]|uniref:IS110 family transposase n=1 Tax=Telluribacter sp. TaxID=1978767 RepID=UPI002E15470A|nr:IS110 family transposase [Telluribacter sp.]